MFRSHTEYSTQLKSVQDKQVLVRLTTEKRLMFAVYDAIGKRVKIDHCDILFGEEEDTSLVRIVSSEKGSKRPHKGYRVRNCWTYLVQRYPTWVKFSGPTKWIKCKDIVINDDEGYLEFRIPFEEKDIYKKPKQEVTSEGEFRPLPETFKTPYGKVTMTTYTLLKMIERGIGYEDFMSEKRGGGLSVLYSLRKRHFLGKGDTITARGLKLLDHIERSMVR